MPPKTSNAPHTEANASVVLATRADSALTARVDNVVKAMTKKIQEVTKEGEANRADVVKECLTGFLPKLEEKYKITPKK